MNADRTLRQARYERARWWLAQGVEVVPLQPRSKALQPGYGAHRAHIADLDFARQWFLNTDANLGIVLGGAAELVVADWDAARPYESWRAGRGAAVETLIEQTARGYHLFFTCSGLHTNVGQGCELKTTGVCMVFPSVHPSGVVYRVVLDSPIASLDRERAHLLFPFLSEPSSEQQRHNAARAAAAVQPEERKRQGPTAASVIARIKMARSIVDEMRVMGIQLQPSSKNTLIGLCPFHSDHAPSLWVNRQSGVWGCNRPDCPAAGTHDVINLRAMRCGISNAMAIRQLIQEFLPPHQKRGRI